MTVRLGLHMDLQLFAQEERHEAPTPRRREQARRRGQVASSQELTGVVVLLVTIASLQLWGPELVSGIMGWTRQLWLEPVREWSPHDLTSLTLGAFAAWGRPLLYVLVVAMVAAIAAGLMQTGLVVSGHSLVPRFDHLNPIKGLQQVISLRGLFELAKNLTKVSIVFVLAVVTVRKSIEHFPELIAMEPAASTAMVSGWLRQLGWRVGLALLVLAVADYAYKRWDYEKNLKMSRDEVKEELRETDGDPMIKGWRRRRQREMAKRRMLQDVARAQVVVTNPDHYAVALRYSPDEMTAPMVVAKGRGYMAQRIKEVARRHGVAVYEDPPLARALYRMVEVGRSIPEELYQAVAEVLAFVWRLKGYHVGS